MANNVSAYVLDHGLLTFTNDATSIYLCSTQPTTYTEATSTYAVGDKVFGAGSTFGSPANGSPTGSRKVTSAAVTDGDETADNTASFWAVTDSVNTRLLGTGQLDNPQMIYSGNNFTLDAFTITLNGQE